MEIKRRDLIKYTVAGLTLSAIPAAYFYRFLGKTQDSAAPIQEISESDLVARTFINDNFPRAHEALWNLEGFLQKKGGIPPASEKTSLVVIGGGLAGLSAAFLLRDFKPIVLERDGRFGGNAKGEQYGDAFYTLGSTYFSNPDKEGDFAKFLEEIGLFSRGRVEEESHVLYKGQLFKGFWDGSTDPEAKEQFERIFNELVKVRESGVTDSLYHRPLTAELRELDEISFAAWLTQKFGKIHPHLKEYFQLYAWSSFLTSIEEISAAQMLSFVAAETADIMVLPGGNPAISQALYKNLSKSCDLRPQALVVNVKLVDDGVEICYDDPEKGLHTIKADRCVFAAPKFIAKKIITGLAADQFEAISKISYRAYVVANLIFDKPVEAPTFGLYSLSGEVPPAPTAANPPKRLFTDSCFATWAQDNRTKNGVLSVYGSLAYDGGRAIIFNPSSYEEYRRRAIDESAPVLKSLNLTEKNIIGVRLSRWGHAMPVSKAGLISSGVLEKAHQPIGGRIFFANQDNLGNPSIESCFAEAQWVNSLVRKA